MKPSTAGKNSTSIRSTIAVAVLAGAGLSGCAVDPYYGSPGYSQSYNQGYNQGYNQPVYGSTRYYGPQTYGPSGYAPARDPYYPPPTYYPSRQPAYYR